MHYSPILLNEGGETDNRALRLYTRKRKFIRNLMRPEWPNENLLEDLTKCRELHPDVKPRSLSSTYNCVGMVFATRRTWVEPDQVPVFLEDDEYERLASLNEAQIGDVIVYQNESGEIVHVGIVISRQEDLSSGEASFKILSKWGAWAEFIHDPEDVLDNFGTPTEIWTDRRLL